MLRCVNCSSGVAPRRVPTASDIVSIVGDGTRLAVLGSPIAHSKSPALHAAAYGVLGLDWSFEAIELAERGVSEFFGGLDDAWRGFAVTMPLKRVVFDQVDHVDALAQRVGAINTLVCGQSERWGFNTDVYGAEQALFELGVQAPRTAVVLGAGATASSVIVALANLGARVLTLVVRSEERAAGARSLAESLGMRVEVMGYTSVLDAAPDVIVSTVPSTARFDADTLSTFVPAGLRRQVPLLDIAYGDAPSDIHAAWLASESRAVSGLSMLLHQAVQQVRIFATGDPNTLLPDEQEVVAAMRSALVGGF